MPDGWRSRYLAPAYALMISFVIVFLVGFAVDSSQPREGTPNQQTTSGSAPKIRFAASGTNAALGELSSVTVHLFGQAPRQSTVDKDGNLNGPTPDQPFTICVELPPGWSAKDARKPENSRYTCWGPFEPGERAELRLSKR